MTPNARRRSFSIVVLFAAAFVLSLLSFSHAQDSVDPWTASQAVQVTDFAKELVAGKSKPTILFVGFARLYAAGHIKGAQFHGVASKPEGLNEMKQWAGALPRSTNLIIYCGCCPMEKCPNIRPAFIALQDMGFTNLRVLILPTSFAVDWAEKGLPYEKDK
jgi:thiosulfate/3-mercaptopyruvate sulfurtransferase